MYYDGTFALACCCSLAAASPSPCPCFLLLRTLPRADDVRYKFEKYGEIRDVYLPKVSRCCCCEGSQHTKHQQQPGWLAAPAALTQHD